ncbi:MAG TPA: diguanylate cyclase [Candidatus Ozemobacteraceae bacterium]|nr:diguanylate cyclase [Candidatus Ozemobacteraceae bacterium]
MNSGRMPLVWRLDSLIALLFIVTYFLAGALGQPLPVVPFFACGALVISCAHLLVHVKIIKPLAYFAKVADDIADGDTRSLNPEILASNSAEDIQASFGKIAGSLIESRDAVENYMQTISDINKQLASKVDSLSLLYSISKAMGGSLSIDSLVRTFLTVINDHMHVNGAMVLLYNDRNDMVTVKDLLGFPPELFARFRFFSDHKIIMNVFAAEEGIWVPDEASVNLMKAEFETDAVHELKLFTPMRIKDHFVGIIVLGSKKDGSDFSESDCKLVQAFTGLATTAVNNAMLYERSESTKNELDRKVFNLMTLQQAGKVLSSTLNLDELIRIAIDMFLETVWSNKGVLMLQGEDSLDMIVRAAKGIPPEELKALEKDAAEVWAMTTLRKEKRPILAQELATKSFFQSYTAINRALAFAVYIPLLKEGEIYGVVKIGAKINGEPFTENDLEFFSTLSSQATIAFENARLYSLAITDSITKLYVHRYFQLRLDEEVKRSRRYNSTLTLLMCDIDHFKEINDKYGHQQGDIILKEVSLILRKNIRSTDIAARYGGEEFVIILPETTQSDARIVAERIRRDVSKFDFPALAPEQPPVKCTISIGVAGFPLNANDKDELIQKADASMYQAKGAGRNRVMLYGIDC